MQTEKLAREAAALAARFPPGSAVPVPVENLHITLHFLGNVEIETERGIRDALGAIVRSFPPLPFRTSRVVCLPGMREPRLLALECIPEDGQATLGLLRSCATLLEEYGLQAERNRWLPHVTLLRFRARNRGPGGKEGAGSSRSIPLNDAIDVREAIEGIREDLRFSAGSLDLMLSELSPRGARYSVVERFPFGVPRDFAPS
jgi:2'-5' RNA ligase